MKIINTSGKRKTAIARATLKEGKGRVRINSVPLEVYGSEIIRMKISEAIALAPGALENVDVTIDVSAGSFRGPAEAGRVRPPGAGQRSGPAGRFRAGENVRDQRDRSAAPERQSDFLRFSEAVRKMVEPRCYFR